MKKIAILTALLMMAAVSAHAADATSSVSFDNAGKTIVSSSDSKNIGKLSASVGLAYVGSASAYAVATQHQKGTKVFGTSFDSTAIYSKDTTTGTAGTVGSVSDSSAFAGWTAM